MRPGPPLRERRGQFPSSEFPGRSPGRNPAGGSFRNPLPAAISSSNLCGVSPLVFPVAGCLPLISIRSRFACKDRYQAGRIPVSGNKKPPAPGRSDLNILSELIVPRVGLALAPCPLGPVAGQSSSQNSRALWMILSKISIAKREAGSMGRLKAIRCEGESGVTVLMVCQSGRRAQFGRRRNEWPMNCPGPGSFSIRSGATCPEAGPARRKGGECAMRPRIRRAPNEFDVVLEGRRDEPIAPGPREGVTAKIAVEQRTALGFFDFRDLIPDNRSAWMRPMPEIIHRVGVAASESVSPREGPTLSSPRGSRGDPGSVTTTCGKMKGGQPCWDRSPGT